MKKQTFFKKTKNKIILFLFLALGGMSSFTYGFDLPEGGDGLFFQLRNAPYRVIARCQKKFITNRYLCKRIQLLSGSRAISSSFVLQQELKFSLTPHKLYVLFLKRRFRNTFELALSYLSALPLKNLREASYLNRAINNYRFFIKSPKKGKHLLLRSLYLKHPYVQYSIVSDLLLFGALQKQEVARIATAWTRNQLVSPRAKFRIMEAVGSYHLTQYIPYLERAALQSRAPISVRQIAIESLVRLQAHTSLQKIQKRLIKNPQLRRRLIHLKERR